MDKELAQVYEEIVAIAKKEVAKSKSSPKYGTAVTASSNGKVEILFDDGTSQTPCSTVSKVHVGDRVMVQVDADSRKATVTGNCSDPAATDSEVRVVNDAVERAAEAADNASASAEIALNSASEAYTAALGAQASADAAATDAMSAFEAAESAQDAARTAADSVVEAAEQALEAQAQAQDAAHEAIQAASYAQGALGSLSTIEDVVDTLNWLSDFGTYVASADTEPISGKTYYEQSFQRTTDARPMEGKTYYDASGNVVTGSEAPATDALMEARYTPVTVDDDVDPSELGLYELSDLDTSVRKYIMSHIALTDAGLYVMLDESGYKLLLAADGSYVVDPSGRVVSKYGEDAQIGNAKGLHIELASSPDGRQARLDFVIGEKPESAEDGMYYISTKVNGEKRYLNMTTTDAFNWGSHQSTTMTLVATESPQLFYISQFSDSHYSIAQTIGSNTYNLMEWDGSSGPGFAGLEIGLIDSRSSHDHHFVLDFVHRPNLGFADATFTLNRSGRYVTNVTYPGSGMPGYLGKSTNPDDAAVWHFESPYESDTRDRPAYIEVIDGVSTFYMTNSIVVRDLRFGKWQWWSRANDNMTLKWIGGE